MIDYTQFPGLTGVYLEDSYVLSISETLARIVFRLDAALTADCLAYRAPRLGEHHCYVIGNLVFDEVIHVDWVERTLSRFTDANGEMDLGSIDILRIDGDAFVVEGDWGMVRVVGAQPRFEVGG